MKASKKNYITRLFWVLFSLPFGLIVLSLLFVSIFSDLPSFEELENPKTYLATELIAEDGEVFNTWHIENRTYVQFEDLSENLVNAALATEDIRFYSHSGIDFRGLARVGVKTLLMGNSSSGGGSTITQQLAKSLFPRDTSRNRFPGEKHAKLVGSKLKEWITAVRLERNYTKNEILSMYMNTIFFGSNAYGIKAASNTFFGKDPIHLNVEESATLVGMVNKPTRYNPVINYDKSLKRRNHVLRQMEKYGFLTEAEHDSIAQLPITLHYRRQDHTSGIGSYFRDMLRRYMSASEPNRRRYANREDYNADLQLWEEDPLYGWLNKNFKPDGSKYNLDKDGLKIYTTLNATMQRYAEEAVVEHLGGYLQPAFFRELKRKPNAPFAMDVPQELTETVMQQARRWSDRYMSMKEDGASEAEIQKAFNVRAKMRVFSWNKQGYVDTVMTPNDSIRYYKSFMRAALIAMEPQTGNIRAYVGGPDYKFFKYDNARQSKRQVGSTIKPFLYTLAMQEGYTPCDKVINVPQTFIVGDTTWTPRSTDKEDWIGMTVTLKWGLTKSSNNITAYLMKQFGPQAMINMCRKLGITTYLPPYPSLCVGPADISVLEMVSAYNTYPSRGVYVSPMMVTRIEDNAGNVLANFSSRKREAISESTAYLMVNLMQGVVNEGTSVRLRSRYVPEGALAGKTGTTNDQSDGWFIGYTPKLTAGVWVGAEDRQVHFETLSMGQGANMALPIWGIFMKKVMEDGTLGIRTTDQFVAPAGWSLSLDCDGSDADASSSGQKEQNYFDDGESFF
ncbi:MAG: transglycosylase domain-containing protein [Bacteroidales bacterium]|nr:transglycosylase domain-containing protein [Bacteroidales bacterium]